MLWVLATVRLIRLRHSTVGLRHSTVGLGMPTAPDPIFNPVAQHDAFLPAGASLQAKDEEG